MWTLFPSAILCHRIKLFQKYIDIKTIFGLNIIKNLIFSGTLQEKLKWVPHLDLVRCSGQESCGNRVDFRLFKEDNLNINIQGTVFSLISGTNRYTRFSC